LAERSTRPAGRSASIAAMTSPNSSITSAESELAPAPARSKITQAMPSASRPTRK
jgi:hypothetical protein